MIKLKDMKLMKQKEFDDLSVDEIVFGGWEIDYISKNSGIKFVDIETVEPGDILYKVWNLFFTEPADYPAMVDKVRVDKKHWNIVRYSILLDNGDIDNDERPREKAICGGRVFFHSREMAEAYVQLKHKLMDSESRKIYFRKPHWFLNDTYFVSSLGGTK